MTDVIAFFFALALAAFATTETAPAKGAVVTRADNVVTVMHTPAGDVAYLPPVAP